MTMILRNGAHPSLRYLPRKEHFTFYDLRDAHDQYGAAALAEHADCLELHLEVFRFGPRAARALAADLEELKALARKRGKARIVGLTQPADLAVDERWFKFTRAFGFSGQRLYQSAELALD